MSERATTPTVRPFAMGLFAPIITADASSEIVYPDPHLVVLLFLLGFCLLYVLAIVADTLSRSADGVNDATEWSSDRS